MAQEKRSAGVVLQFSDQKGYGFIKPDDGGEDVFVHQSTIKSDGFRTLKVGDKVEFAFSVGPDQKSRAVDVTGPDGSSLPSNRRDNYGREGPRRNTGNFSFNGRSGLGGGRSSAWKTEGCYVCNKSGHLARDCPDSVGSGGATGDCYSCGKGGHLARDCPSKGGCYKCGEVGHMARDCGRSGGRVGGSGGGSCYTCGGIGHMARDCKGMAKEGSNGGRFGGGDKRGCFHCGEQGHFARECPDTTEA